jgi:hypothetical protein
VDTPYVSRDQRHDPITACKCYSSQLTDSATLANVTGGVKCGQKLSFEETQTAKIHLTLAACAHISCLPCAKSEVDSNYVSQSDDMCNAAQCARHSINANYDSECIDGARLPPYPAPICLVLHQPLSVATALHITQYLNSS